MAEKPSELEGQIHDWHLYVPIGLPMMINALDALKFYGKDHGFRHARIDSSGVDVYSWKDSKQWQRNPDGTTGGKKGTVALVSCGLDEIVDGSNSKPVLTVYCYAGLNDEAKKAFDKSLQEITGAEIKIV